MTAAKDNYIFEVEDLLTGAKEFAHGQRLKLFQNKSFEITEELTEHLEYQRAELLVIDSFEDIRQIQNRTEVLFRWKGLDGEEDWDTIASLQEDVPELLMEFIGELKLDETKRQRQKAASI